MREYRIYDQLEENYIQEPDYRWLLSREGMLYDSENDRWHTVGERYLVEFSTGLLDKNKKNIFENDFVSGYTGSHNVVEYKNGAFCWGDTPIVFDLDDDGIIIPYDTKTWATIIGNVHDNPELLQS